MPLGKFCETKLELRARIEQVSLVSRTTKSGVMVEWRSQDGEVGQAGGIHLSILAGEAVPLSLCMNECEASICEEPARWFTCETQGWLRGGGWVSIVSAGRAVKSVGDRDHSLSF
jgi:hypothetical protein